MLFAFLKSNCNGRFGKKALEPVRLGAIRNTIFKYYPCSENLGEDEQGVWIRDCVPAIDESNRVLKKQLIAWKKKTGNMNSFSQRQHQNCASFSVSNGNNYPSMAMMDDPDFDEELEDF